MTRFAPCPLGHIVAVLWFSGSACGAAIAQSAATGSTGIASPEPPLLLRPTRTLSAPFDRSGVALPAYVRSDRLSGVVERELVLEGDAQLRRGAVDLRAERIIWHQVSNVLDADGNVRFQRAGDAWTGPTLRYDLDTSEGELGEGDYRIGANGGHGSASLTEFAGRDLLKMRSATYTTCPVGDGSWILRAREILVDQDQDEGEARGATVYFKGVPIFASPYVGFATEGGRKTGLLTPTFGISSKNGIELIEPLYVNIAPNRDYTFTPRILSKRGIELGNEVRYLGIGYRGETRANYVPNDKLFGGQRWSLQTSHQQDLASVAQGVGGYWNISRVSDNQYVSDFSRSIVGVTNRQLTQEGGLTASSTWWNALLRVQKFQILQDPAQLVAVPYQRVPQLTSRFFRYDVAGFDLNLETDASRFDHPQSTFVTGTRVVAAPSVSYPLISSSWFMTPRLSANSAYYSLDRTRLAPGQTADYARTIPTASIDSGLVFERDATLFRRAATQTLEPRLFYVRTPYRNQDRAPLFDTALADFNLAQLFAENRFSGYDRISDANNLTAAVTTRFLEPESGAEIFRATAGQRYYLDAARVTATPGEAPSTAQRTDFLLSAAGRLLRDVRADATVQLDSRTARATRSSLGVRWSPSPGKIASLNYRYIQSAPNQLEQYDAAGQWTLGANWVGVSRIVYSTLERRLVEGLIGVEYRSCCWTARVVAQRFVTSAIDRNTSIFFELELIGLTRLGSSPADALRRSIPGYRPIEDRRLGPGSLQYGLGPGLE